MTVPNAATRLFNIPELLELILLQLPQDTTHQEISSMRFILQSRTVTRTWHSLIEQSTPLRQRLYLPNPLDATGAKAYLEKSAFPPARPNPWIPHLMLSQRSWGSAYPFSNTMQAFDFNQCDDPEPIEELFWTFSFELSNAQWKRLPPSGPWREMLVSSPPFTDFWFTRSFYELGSGRAPFVTHLDYDPKLHKSEQRYRFHREGGVRIGDLVDAFVELFGRHPNAKFVMVESLRVPSSGENGQKVMLQDDRPTSRPFLPGSSAERWVGDGYWH